MDWLLVGALREEVQPVVATLENPRRIDRRTVCGELHGARIAVVRCGVGPDAAYSRTRAAIEKFAPKWVASFGTCGSLSQTLPVGTVVAASRIARPNTPWQDVPTLETCIPVDLITITAPAWNDEAAIPLRAQGADVCEMEAAAVLEAAGERPTYAVKVVSDVVALSKPPRILRGGLPHPADLLAFKRLARQLTQDHLVPTLNALVYSVFSGT